MLAQRRHGNAPGGHVIAFDRFDDQLLGDAAALPALELDPFARLQIFVMREEMLDLLDQDVGQVGVFGHIVVIGMNLVDADTEQLGIAAGIVFHHHHADRPHPADAAGHERRARHHQRVDRVAIIGEGVRNKAVVGRIPHRGVENAVDEQRARRLVEFIFDRFAAKRAFDHDIDIVRGVHADGNLVNAHVGLLAMSVG